MKKLSLLFLALISFNSFADDENYALKKLESSCEKGEMQDCTLAGKMYIDADKGEKAISLFEKSCSQNFIPGCTALGATYYSGLGKVQTDKKKGIEILTDACDKKEGGACGVLAYAYMMGDGVQTDYKKAMKIFRLLCDKKNAEACHFAGDMFMQGWGVTQDFNLAAEHYARGCSYGLKKSCEEYKALDSEGFVTHSE